MPSKATKTPRGNMLGRQHFAETVSASVRYMTLVAMTRFDSAVRGVTSLSFTRETVDRLF